MEESHALKSNFKMPETSNQRKYDGWKICHEINGSHLERPFFGRYPLVEVVVEAQPLLAVAASVIDGDKTADENILASRTTL